MLLKEYADTSSIKDQFVGKDSSSVGDLPIPVGAFPSSVGSLPSLVGAFPTLVGKDSLSVGVFPSLVESLPVAEAKEIVAERGWEKVAGGDLRWIFTVFVPESLYATQERPQAKAGGQSGAAAVPCNSCRFEDAGREKQTKSGPKLFIRRYAISTYIGLQTHRRPAGSHQSAGRRASTGGALPDVAGGYRIGENLYRS